MTINLSERDYRLLLDLVYSGNWVLNSAREDDRIEDYDRVAANIFSYATTVGLDEVVENGCLPSQSYMEGGIHEAILDYEDSIFYGILAEELSRRDLKGHDVDGSESALLSEKIDEYMAEFTKNGVDNVIIDENN